VKKTQGHASRRFNEDSEDLGAQEYGVGGQGRRSSSAKIKLWFWGLDQLCRDGEATGGAGPDRRIKAAYQD